MTLLQSVLLGILQGLTEFLPVSSSGHLLLVERLFGLKNVPLAYDIALHAASLLAILIYFRKIILSLIQSLFHREMKEEHSIIIAVIVGTGTTALLMLPIRPLVEAMRHAPILLSLTFAVTAFVLLIAQVVMNRQTTATQKSTLSWKDAIFVGALQSMALFPGISRSGSTLSGALLRGASGERAMEFSFLLAIPAILGASLLESRNIATLGNPSVVLAGVAASFVFSLLSLKLLALLIKKMRLSLFSVYLLLLATAVPFIV